MRLVGLLFPAVGVLVAGVSLCHEPLTVLSRPGVNSVPVVPRRPHGTLDPGSLWITIVSAGEYFLNDPPAGDLENRSTKG